MGSSQLATVAGRDIAWLLADRAERWPDKPFLVWAPFDEGEQIRSYAEFHREVLSMAAGFQAAGVKPSDRILIHMSNSPQALIAWFASAVIGTIAVTTNTAATHAEMRHFIARTEPVLAIIDAEYASLFEGEPHLAGIYVRCDSKALGETSFKSLDDLYLDPAHLERVRDPLHPLSIQFTSGSTSTPKAVLWTHGNALWGAQISAMHQGLDASDVYQCCLPFFHTNAQTYMILPTLWSGGTVVLQPRFSASNFWPTALKHGCTRASIVPFCLRALWDKVPTEPHSFKTWGLGVAHPEASKHFGLEILGWWGMTETISQCIVSDGFSHHAYMSMGRASPAYELEIRDEDGSACDANEVGRLFIRGQRGVSLFAEYFGDEQATKAAFDEDGWFSTGDLVFRNEAGDLFFDSRASDIIKCGGENVSPREIETTLSQVDGVREAAVIGKSDPMYGEVPVAFVIGDQSDETLVPRAFAKCEEQLAGFKVPREITVLAELPRASLNKVAKGQLRQQFAATST